MQLPQPFAKRLEKQLKANRWNSYIRQRFLIEEWLKTSWERRQRWSHVPEFTGRFRQEILGYVRKLRELDAKYKAETSRPQD